jgi:hypothetical protein
MSGSATALNFNSPTILTTQTPLTLLPNSAAGHCAVARFTHRRLLTPQPTRRPAQPTPCPALAAAPGRGGGGGCHLRRNLGGTGSEIRHLPPPPPHPPPSPPAAGMAYVVRRSVDRARRVGGRAMCASTTCAAAPTAAPAPTPSPLRSAARPADEASPLAAVAAQLHPPPAAHGSAGGGGGGVGAVSEARLSAAVAAHRALPPSARGADLDATAPHAHSLAAAIAAGADDGVRFLLDTRALTALPSLPRNAPAHAASPGTPTWVKTWDAAAAAALRPLCAPALLQPLQLSVSPAAGPAMAALVAAARAGETVNKADSHVDLMRRFGPRRMVHALAHAAAPDALLAVLYTAVLPVWPSTLAQVDEHTGGPPPPAGAWRPTPADASAPLTTAAFYSVSSPHPASRGLRLPTRLILRVATALAGALPQLTTFSTLSPIPGLLAWVGHGGCDNTVFAAPGARDAVAAAAAAASLPAAAPPADAAPAAVRACFTHLLAATPGWLHDPAVATPLRPLLVAACRAHLSHAAAAPGKGGCKVAAFHRSNGAVLARLCWAGDPSPVGLSRSGGMMANYAYSTTGAAGLTRTAWVAGEVASPGRRMDGVDRDEADAPLVG